MCKYKVKKKNITKMEKTEAELNWVKNFELS